MGIGCFGSAKHFFIRGVRLSIPDVLHHCPGKQIHVLLYNAYMVPETLQLDFSHIRAVQAYASAAHIIESGNETAQGCLTRT